MYTIPQIVLSAKTTPLTFVLESAVKHSLTHWNSTLIWEFLLPRVLYPVCVQIQYDETRLCSLRDDICQECHFFQSVAEVSTEFCPTHPVHF
jgi:hypothetical protein